MKFLVLLVFLFVIIVCDVCFAGKDHRAFNRDPFDRGIFLRGSTNNNRYYRLWPSSKIHSTLLQWAETYPDLIRVFTAQDAYGLQAAGGTADCPFDKNVKGCLNYVAVLQNYIAHPEGSKSSNILPEVLWSGEVHGDERVGPTAVVEAAKLLLEATSCETNTTTATATTMTTDCRNSLLKYGIDDANRKWLTRLLSTRRIVIVPTGNALGYYRRVRGEGSVDPNRDFPYDVLDSKECMQTIAARTLNEVYREHMFQMSLTFHGGIELIGYEWGATGKVGYLSPDDVGQNRVSEGLSNFAGSFRGTPDYEYGSMNEILYAVRGGMEDWAYAGSYDTESMIVCEPTTFGGYKSSKTKYTNGTLRAFNLLVETSNNKSPTILSLGTSDNVMVSDSKGNGHVARNVRLALAAADLVEPYVVINSINNVRRLDDVAPMIPRNQITCNDINTVKIPFSNQQNNINNTNNNNNNNNITIEWTIGGALEVDTTMAWFTKWENIINSKTINCFTQQPSKMVDVQKDMIQATTIGSSNGFGKLSVSGETTFRAIIDDLSTKTGTTSTTFSVGDELALIVSARVDQSWSKRVDNIIPNVPPQSHIVNVRTNPSWYYKNNDGKIIQGRLDWFSIPVHIVLV